MTHTNTIEAASRGESALERGVGRLAPERAEGLRAARSGLLFDSCPYTFQACGFDKQRFDRKKLQAWWDGWSQHYMKTLGFLPHANRMPHEGR